MFDNLGADGRSGARLERGFGWAACAGDRVTGQTVAMFEGLKSVSRDEAVREDGAY